MCTMQMRRTALETQITALQQELERTGSVAAAEYKKLEEKVSMA